MIRRLELFKDEAGTVPLSDDGTINLGELDIDEERTLEFYIKNTGETNLTRINLSHSFPDITIEGVPERLNAGESIKCTLSWKPKNENDEGIIVKDLVIKAKSVGLS